MNIAEEQEIKAAEETILKAGCIPQEHLPGILMELNEYRLKTYTKGGQEAWTALRKCKQAASSLEGVKEHFASTEIYPAQYEAYCKYARMVLSVAGVKNVNTGKPWSPEKVVKEMSGFKTKAGNPQALGTTLMGRILSANFAEQVVLSDEATKQLEAQFLLVGRAFYTFHFIMNAVNAHIAQGILLGANKKAVRQLQQVINDILDGIEGSESKRAEKRLAVDLEMRPGFSLTTLYNRFAAFRSIPEGGAKYKWFAAFVLKYAPMMYDLYIAITNGSEGFHNCPLSDAEKQSHQVALEVRPEFGRVDIVYGILQVDTSTLETLRVSA